MKPILIDKLIKESHTKTEINMKINGRDVHGWQIAKPLNYHFNLFEKIKLATYILRGKAIAVQFFEDMSEDEKDKYVKKQLNEK